MKKSLTENAQRLIFLVVLLSLWELTARHGPWPKYLFPPPSKVGESLVTLMKNGSLARATLRSMIRLFEGYAISACLGVPLGFLIARVKFFRVNVKPIVMGLQALPSICWLPLALLWFGLSESAIIFVVVMGSLLAISISAEDAVLGIQPILLNVSGTLGIKGRRFYTGVLGPAALPGVVTGLKLGWSFAWRALMAGELLFVSGGLGQLLTVGRDLLDVAQVMGVMIAIVVIGMVVDRVVFRTVEVRIRRRWGLVAQA